MSRPLTQTPDLSRLGTRKAKPRRLIFVKLTISAVALSPFTSPRDYLKPAMKNPAPLPVVALASPVYWPDLQKLIALFGAISGHLSATSSRPLVFHLIHGEPPAEMLSGLAGETAVLLPLSGGVQPALITLAARLAHVALANAYLPGFLPAEYTSALLHRNAHPACTDFFAHARLGGRPARWLASLDDLHTYAQAHAAVAALRSARILRIGETEPWVINSTRDPVRFRAALGCEIVPLPAEALYEEFARVTEDDPDARSLGDDWWHSARQRLDTVPADARKAARVAIAMRRLLEEHRADALAMACFAMIGALDTTSCLAIATLNDAAHIIGACEGDLDAAVTLYLLKKLGADFVWIANPIIHAADRLDLAHCTAPRCACGEALPYRLMRHHESGRGIAPEVRLPGDRTVTLARIGADLTELCVHPGHTETVAKQPTCHTQIRVRIPSSRQFLDTLNGTHVVMSYGDHRAALSICAELLGLRLTGSSDLDPAPSAITVPTVPVVCACVPA
jgi:L-fucose isomerase-like protein